MKLRALVCRWICFALLLVFARIGAAQAGVALLLPSGVAYDSAGNLYIADAHKHQIFEVTLAGVTSVVAGTGAQGFSGDGAPATSALLNAPASVAVAPDGTIYIADTGNHRIRSIFAGQIHTVAGTGTRGFSGDNATATLAQLNTPQAIAVDATGALLIADSGNHRLRRLFAGTVTTLAGTGVQGFAGDGASATSAQLDTPSGVALAPDGHIFIADSHNHRLRVIATDGNIATFAGSGLRGFAGDGAAAVNASLWLPRGVAVTAAGEVIFADSDNQRLRMVDTHGIISTIAGNGVQGNSAEGTPAKTSPLDSPRAVAVSSFALPIFADTHNRAVREVALDAAIYTPAGGPTHTVTVTLNSPAPLTYGQGTINATVTGAAPQAQGNIALLDSGLPISTTTLSGTAAVLRADTLTAGQHMLTALFAGDGIHAAAVSPAATLTVAPLSLTATAQAATIPYGGFTPSLTGTLTGVLTRDASNVTVSFTSTAPDLATVGSYAILPSLSGPASSNYIVTEAATSGSLQIVPAASLVTLNAPQVSYAGLPVTITATINSSTRGVPTGAVNFIENGSLVATASIASGAATAVYLSPGSGRHAISATYTGDHNFLAASSSAASITVSPMPDFSLSATGNATQTVQGGAIATYTFQVAAQPGPFSGSVNLSTTGLPSGATASFSPPAVIPGNTSAVVTMSIQTTALAMRTTKLDIRFALLCAFGLAWTRRRKRGLMTTAVLTMVLCSTVGCGDRSFSAAIHQSQSFPLTVTATSTNLAGAIVVHSTSVVLIVQ